ncbi:similar to Saccharomyces cerevisiae YIL042C PKP1 Mitochondrial protein kinase [Maudiozyma barnettii]|uniref:Protein-serine/threonine kinase n=1 Tax=Maudiozyma barnettii TaxID=61262 RepID=A0A8H2ZJ39_9SACH|nr:protein kinase PKP1 [Kazachstania barnettii]CAB4256568.1 similar to Saccharomyces cerevisiae YIL042C PKP1 Mitochondrial protein kinase [Kazachstania barnettii]CAD1785171.1 similar to Saccharomyces cerevisiae YIL042C PKP1 Mitochondrial protein kinase [Kazachstania barnettii]
MLYVTNTILRPASFRLQQRSFHIFTSLRKPNDVSQSVLANLTFEDHYNIRSNIESLIQDYSRRRVPALTFAFLTQHRQRPLPSSELYTLNIQIMNYLLTYTCRQLTALQQLPYIAILNPKIEQTYALYLKTLTALLDNKFPYDLYDRQKMRVLLRQFLDDHQDTLQTLSDGMTEIMEAFPKNSVFLFLNEHLKNRITMKLLATHYVELISQQERRPQARLNDSQNKVGIVQRDVPLAPFITRIYEFVNDLCLLKYDHQPINLTFTQGEDIKFSCIPIILEYLMTEILKNSMRATIESSAKNNTHPKDIEVSIFEAGPSKVLIRVRDYGGGIPEALERKIFDYSYTSTTDPTLTNDSTENKDIDDIHCSVAEDQMLPGQTVHNIAGMGFGLPLCKTYLDLFGGKIDIQSLAGRGTDVYITLTGPTEKMLDCNTEP